MIVCGAIRGLERGADFVPRLRRWKPEGWRREKRYEGYGEKRWQDARAST
jgi:hypothetical protein